MSAPAAPPLPPIAVYQRPDEPTRTPEQSCEWIGEAVVNGTPYTSRSRMSPATDIARQLVAEGLADRPLVIRSTGIAGHTTWPSFHEAAKWTYEEGPKVAARRTSYARVEAARERARRRWVGGPKQGVKPARGIPVAPIPPVTSKTTISGATHV
jgi:hypothetical protein